MRDSLSCPFCGTIIPVHSYLYMFTNCEHCGAKIALDLLLSLFAEAEERFMQSPSARYAR